MSMITMVAHRLTQLREGLGLNQTEIAAKLGISKTRWNNWEAGVRLIEPREAIELAVLCGTTLDYIYRGVAPTDRRRKYRHHEDD